MKYGIREICDVVLKAKANQKVGNKIFYKGEPVVYFDTLKTSSLEGAATTVYAQGGRGNSRLVAWEGERTVTFTMEDALISTAGLLILTGAGLVEPANTSEGYIPVHVVETVEKTNDQEASATIETEETPSAHKNATIYVFPLINGEIFTEPYIGTKDGKGVKIDSVADTDGNDEFDSAYEPTDWEKDFAKADAFLIDYYYDKTSAVQQIEITPDKFGGNYYLEASTLFRDTNGTDMPAEFIIPNCKVQSNFTFTMASSGDPSTFTFTMDAFPDYTMFNKKTKVLAAIQILADDETKDEVVRTSTVHATDHEELIK